MNDRDTARNLRPDQATNRRLDRLRWYNLAMGVFHLAQGVLILVLANDFTLPVLGHFLEGPPGSAPPEPTLLFDLRVAWGVAAFVFISALAHFTLSLFAHGWYRNQLLHKRNYARWIEYSFSSSIMIVLIAMLTGIYSAAALVALFGANAAMILFGWLQEKYERPGEIAGSGWLSFIFGSIVGIFPWVAIAIYLFSPGSPGEPPTFVYAIFVSLFVFFNIFALNMVLQYKRVGWWSNYLFGEAVYVFLSLTAKTALAWQVFAATLVE